MAKRITVAVDANGADLGPSEVAAGAAVAAARGTRVLIFGPAQEIGEVADGVEVVDAPVSIAKASDPARAARSTPESSIVQAAKAVACGDADALVSGGSTGTALAAGLFNIRRAAGIYRPALAIPMPIPGSPALLLDVGANVEVRSEYLVQFAFMGVAFSRAVLGIACPRVGLLSNGSEPTKGTPLVIEAHNQLSTLMAGAPDLEFIGNIEGNDVTAGVADVVVMDGFTGNVTLKVMEGSLATMLKAIGDVSKGSLRDRAGGLLLAPGIRELRDELDPETTGGAYMLGLRRLGVVTHGRFTRRGFARAIELAERGVREDLVGRTHAALEAAGALRSSPSGGGSSVDA
ncbi:MAG: phosphate acyltransferase PlsX [Actinomycetota bacterium]